LATTEWTSCPVTKTTQFKFSNASAWPVLYMLGGFVKNFQKTGQRERFFLPLACHSLNVESFGGLLFAPAGGG
jgi:hypothetical protein